MNPISEERGNETAAVEQLGMFRSFGILERGGKVKVEGVGDMKGDTLLELAIKKVKRVSLIYTERFRSYNGLVSYGFKHRRIDQGENFADVKG